MNRTQRRAGKKLKPAAGPRPGGAAQESAGDLFARAAAHHQRGEVGSAVHLYKKVLALDPGHALACEQLR